MCIFKTETIQAHLSKELKNKKKIKILFHDGKYEIHSKQPKQHDLLARDRNGMLFLKFKIFWFDCVDFQGASTHGSLAMEQSAWWVSPRATPMSLPQKVVNQVQTLALSKLSGQLSQRNSWNSP